MTHSKRRFCDSVNGGGRQQMVVTDAEDGPTALLDRLFLNGRLLSSFVVPLWYVYLFYNMKQTFFSSSRCVWVCSCGNRRWNEIADKRTKLRPLQDMWYQGPEPKHQLGGAGRRRRTSLQRNVNQVLFIIQDYQQMCLSMDLKTCNKQNEMSLDMNSQHIQVGGWGDSMKSTQKTGL